MRPRQSEATLLLVFIALVALPVAARAQGRSANQPTRAGYLGGSFLLWATGPTRQDPAGPGYLQNHIHGALSWPARGALINGGVFVGKHWTLGGELGVRGRRATAVSEDSRAMFEEWHLSSVYTFREQLASIVVQRHASARARVDLKPLAGLTISHATQSLTGRRGTYSYPPVGVVATSRPDVSTKGTHLGLVGGADLTFYTRSRFAIVSGARLHRIRRPTYTNQVRPTPAAGPFVLQIAVGARWER